MPVCVVNHDAPIRRWFKEFLTSHGIKQIRATVCNILFWLSFLSMML